MNIVNKRIAKNTLLLYIRLFFLMIISLYTVRIVLEKLGLIDFGLYNVIGGIVIMFSFLSGTLNVAAQRFFSFEIGKNDTKQLSKVFSITLTLYFLICLVILILSETIGLWFLSNKLVIPESRYIAAQWVYQFSVLSFIISLLMVPFNALIIAYERMNIYAYVSIIEGGLKLVVVFLLTVINGDNLIVYAFLLLIVTLLVSIIYFIYCRSHFEVSRYVFIWDRKLFEKILGFSGWNLFGALAGVLNKQGVSIVLNLFFGAIINASTAIAFRVNATLNQFVVNFITAGSPQIIKFYANREIDKMLKLVFQVSKLSFILFFVSTIPIIFETSFLLSLWLKDVPTTTVIFTRLIVVSAIIDSLSYPLMTAAQATGNIKKYQMVIGGTMLLALPLSYLSLSLGNPSYSVFIIAIGFSILTLAIRIYFLKEMVGLNIFDYLSRVLGPMIIFVILSYILPYILVNSFDQGFERFLLNILFSPLISLSILYLIILGKDERSIIINLIRRKK